MDTSLLKKVGSIDQLCGIRESKLLNGAGEGMAVAEFHNAAGLRFTVTPQRCMDIYEMSYKGVNISFLSRNGLRSSHSYTAMDGEFTRQWGGGMLATCGLDNVGGNCTVDGITYPVHGRISAVPAKSFGTRAWWDGDTYTLEARGEMHQSRLYGAHLMLERAVRTTMNATSLTVSDRITNLDAAPEPYMLLYHCNFGYPLLDECAAVLTTPARVEPLSPLTGLPGTMLAPEDGRDEELYLYHNESRTCAAMLYNPELELAGYVAYSSEFLPNFLEWKMMKSHDYVLALEPCNTCGLNREQAMREGKIAVLSPYSAIETKLEIGVLDGKEAIESFIGRHGLSADIRSI